MKNNHIIEILVLYNLWLNYAITDSKPYFLLLFIMVILLDGFNYSIMSHLLLYSSKIGSLSILLHGVSNNQHFNMNLLVAIIYRSNYLYFSTLL